MKCINLKNPEVKKKFDIVKYATNSKVAYDTFLQNDFSNHVIPFDKAANGNDSKLFKELVDAYGLTNAIKQSILFRSKSFTDVFGDWVHSPSEFKGELDENNEPTLNSIMTATYNSLSSADGIDLENNVDLALKEKIRKESIFNIGDLTEKEIIDVLDTAIGLSHKVIEKGDINKTVLYNSIQAALLDKVVEIDNILKEKSDKLSSAQTSYLIRAASILENFKNEDNFNKLIQMVDLRLDDLGYKQIDAEPTTDIKDKTLSDPILKEAWNDDKKWTIPVKDTIQFQLKAVLAGIRIPKYVNGIDTGVKEMNSIMYPKRYDVNILINDLISYLGNTKTGYQSLIDRLAKSERPEFIEIANVMQSDVPNIGRIRNAFVSAMARTPNSKVTVLNTGDRYVVYKTDKSLDRRYITDTWYSNQANLIGKNDVFTIDDNGNINLSKDGLNRLKLKMETLRDIVVAKESTYVELKNLLSTLKGITSSPNYISATNEVKLSLISSVLKGFTGGFYTNDYFSKQNSLIMETFSKVFKDTGNDVILTTDNVNDIEEVINTTPVVVNDPKATIDTESKQIKIELMVPIIQEVFNQIGMDFKNETIKKFLNSPDKYMINLVDEETIASYNGISLFDLTKIGRNSGGVNILYTLFNDLTSERNLDTNEKSIRNNNPLNNRAVTKVFTYLKEIEELDTRQSTFINGEGNQESSYGLPSMLTDIFDSVKNDDVEANQILNNPFSSTNIWLNNLYKAGDIAIKSNRLELVYLDTMKDGETKIGKKKNGMSPRELQVFRVNLFANNNAGYQGNKLTVMNPLVFSDKSRDIGLIMPKLPIIKGQTRWTLDENGLVTDLNLTGNAYKGLASLVFGELKRINEVSKDVAAGNAGNHSSAFLAGYTKFFFFPEMNDSGFEEEFFIEGQYNLADKGLREAVKGHIERAIMYEVNEALMTWKSEGMITTMNNFVELDSNYKKDLDLLYESKTAEIYGLDRELNKTKLVHMATELVVNEFVANGGMIQLIADPAEFYKKGDTTSQFIRTAYDGLHKRLGGVAGPRAKLGTEYKVNIDGKDEVINHSEIVYAVINDVKTSRYLDEYKTTLGKEGWKDIELTDGQELTTLREHIVDLYGMGRLDDVIFQSIYSKIMDSYKYETEVVLTEDETFAIMPQKPLYTGHSYSKIGDADETQANTVFRRFNYVKSSSIPLISKYTKGTPLDELRKKAEKIERDNMFNKKGGRNKNKNVITVRMPFASAYKAGATNVNKIFNEDFSINQPGLDDFKYTVLDRKNFGIQQEESKHDEFKIHSVSQMNKLIHLFTTTLDGFNLPGDSKSYTGLELKQMKEELKGKMINNARKKLLDKLAFKNGEFTDPYKLFEYIKEKSTGKLNPNELENIRLVDGKFVVPLYLNKSFNSIMSSVLSDISDGVLRPKISGRGYTQVSNVGMVIDMSKVVESDIVFTDKFDGRLKYTRYENGDLKYAQVLISRELFEQDSRFNLNDRIVVENGKKVIKFDVIDEELFKLIGARIPNQKHSSMLTIEVVGLLPEGFEDTIVVPDEIVKQMGSDFDIDHLYSYFYNYKLKYDLADEITDISEFEKEVEIHANKKEYDLRYKKIMKNIKRKNYDVNKAKAGIAKRMGMFWNVSDQKLYSKIVNTRLEKVTDKNTSPTSKDVLENKYIDIHHAILSHPEVVKMMTSALDYSDTKDFVDEYQPLLEERDTRTGFLNPLGYTYNINEYKNNQGGKSGVAIQSNFSMLYTLLETNSLYLKDNEVGSETGGNFYFNLDGLVLGDLGHGSYKYKGEDRSNVDIITMLQNESVDNAKNKRLRYLGYTDEFSGIYNLLTALKDKSDKSLSLHFIAKFMNQPIMKEILRVVQNNNDALADSYSTNYNAINEVVNRLESTYDVSKVELTGDKLEKVLKRQLSEEDVLNIQYTVALTVLDLYKYGENLQSIFQSMNDETASVGKDLNEALAKFYKFNANVLNNDLIGNVTALAGRVVKGDTRTLVDKTEMGNNVSNGHLLALKIWRGKVNGQYVSLQGTKQFMQILDKLMDGRTRIPNAKQIKAVETFLTNYIVTSINNPLLQSDGKQVDLGTLRKSFLFGDNSLFNRIKDYLGDKSNVTGREFLSNIEIVPTSNINEPKILKYNVYNSSSIKEGILTDSFVNLLMGNEKERALGYDLLRYCMINGWSFTSINLNRLLPSIFINNTNIGDALRNTSLDGIDIDKVYEQMIQHNPDVLMYPKSGTVLKDPAKSAGAYVIIEDYKGLPDYIKLKSFKKIRPFKRIGTTAEGIVFKVLDNLGTDTVGVMETQNVIGEAKSMLPLNKPYRTFDNVDTRRELPTFVANTGYRVITNVPGLIENPIEEDYGITDKLDKTGIQVVLNRFSLDNSSVGKYFSEAINSIENITLEINHDLKTRGNYYNGSISINPARMFEQEDRQQKGLELEETILHELTHGITAKDAELYEKGLLEAGPLKTKMGVMARLMQSIITEINKAGGERAATMNTFFDKVNRFNKGDKTVTFDRNEVNAFQPLLNLPEFLAGGASNVKFLESIADIEIEGKSAFEKFIDAIMKVFEAVVDYHKFGDKSAALEVMRGTLSVIEEYKKSNDKKIVLESKSNVSTVTTPLPYKVGTLNYIVDVTDVEHMTVIRKSGLAVSEKEYMRVLANFLPEHNMGTIVEIDNPNPTKDNKLKYAIISVNNEFFTVSLNESSAGEIIVSEDILKRIDEKVLGKEGIDIKNEVIEKVEPVKVEENKIENTDEYFNEGKFYSTFNEFEKDFLKDEFNLNNLSIPLANAQRKAARTNLINNKNTQQASVLRKYLKEVYEKGGMDLVLGKGINTTYHVQLINTGKKFTSPNISYETFEGRMDYYYGEESREGLGSKTTLDAIIEGNRTATTRFESDNNIDYWKKVKVGDHIIWKDKSGRSVEVEVTKELHPLKGSLKTSEQWSKLEGWSVAHFNRKVRPRLDEAYQIEFKLMDNNYNSLGNSDVKIVDRKSNNPIIKEQFDDFFDRTAKQTIKELEKEHLAIDEDYEGYETAKQAVSRATELNEVSDLHTHFYAISEKSISGETRYFIGNAKFNSNSLANMEARGQSDNVKAILWEVMANKDGKYSPKLVEQANFLNSIAKLDDIKLRVLEDEDYFYYNPLHVSENETDVENYSPDKLPNAISYGNEVYARMSSTAADMLHEVTHSLAMEMLDSNSKEAKEFKKYFNELKEYLAENGMTEDDHYGLKDVHEFVSEIASNEHFINTLSTIEGVRDKSKTADVESLDELSKQVAFRNALAEEAVVKVKELLTSVAKNGISKSVFLRNLDKHGITLEQAKQMPAEDVFLLSKEYEPGQKDLFMRNQNTMIEYTEINFRSDAAKFKCKYL